MHRHGYIGRKFGRERDQRFALKRGLMRSLVENGAIKTTLPKAKEIRRPMEKLITLAKKGDLASRRRVISELGDVQIANKLVDEIAPKIKRTSGYLRVVKLEEYRIGDNAPMARIEFVDPISDKNEATSNKESTEPVIANEEAEPNTTVKKPTAKTAKTTAGQKGEKK